VIRGLEKLLSGGTMYLKDEALVKEAGSWAHAVNGREQLADAVGSRTVRRIEVDVCWNSVLKVPVMRHAKVSELSAIEECTVDQWMQACLLAIKNGRPIEVIKLDFKDLVRSPPIALHELEMATSKLRLSQRELPEIWLNADILGTDGTWDIDEVEAYFNSCGAFIKRNLDKFKTKYSLGWRTHFAPCSFRESAYDPGCIREMKVLVKQFTPPDAQVTFAVRASFMVASLDDLQNLLLDPLSADTKRKEVSLTVWTGWEGIPIAELITIYKRCKDADITAYFDTTRGNKLSWFNPMRFFYYAMD